MNQPAVKLHVSQIEKSFPGVKALDKVDFSVRAGTVHVLCGENGAGKSTLMKIINGVYQADAGQIFIDGQPVAMENPQKARELGISMIFQEMNYVPEMTVEENLFLGRLPVNRWGKVQWRQVREETEALLAAEQLHYSPTTKMKDLTVSDIQMLEILKAVSLQADIIIMDEPTSAITVQEVGKLFAKIAQLKARGVAIIYISHKLEEIFQIADDITIFRDGAVVASHPCEELTIDQVITYMVGRKLSQTYPKEEVAFGDELLKVEGLSSEGVFEDIHFHVRCGEVVGFAGLMGAGRTEVMRALVGLDPHTAGKVYMRQQPVVIRNVREGIAQGLIMLSEDRRRYGIIPMRSVKENASLSSLQRFFYHFYHHDQEERRVIGNIFGKMNVKTPSQETPIASLSGGNQQKVVLSKWVLREADVMILDEPTRGIDIGAKYEIYRLIGQLAKQGKGLVIVSSELPELLGICDRIYVMAKGCITGELARTDFSQEQIMRYATGVM